MRNFRMILNFRFNSNIFIKIVEKFLKSAIYLNKEELILRHSIKNYLIGLEVSIPLSRI